MTIEQKQLDELTPYEKNPRVISDKAVDAVAASIEQFGFNVPIVIDNDNVIVAGHTRYKAAEQLGMQEVPCIRVKDLSDDEVRAYRLADNKTAELSSWDNMLMTGELAYLQQHIDMEQFGFEFESLEPEPSENPYTMDVKIPQHEPSGEDVDILELVDSSKQDELIDSIDAAEIPEEIKDFLYKAAARHNEFNYSKIAEYYAGASPEIQELFEESALVIIDYEDAIAQGYVKLNKTVEDMLSEL